MRILLPLLFVFLWSGAFVATRAGFPDISPITFLAARFTLAAIILLPLTFLHIRWCGWQSARRVWPHLLVSGVLLNGANLTAGYWSLTELSAATVALIGSLQPLVTAFLSGAILGDRFTWTQWLGFVLGTLGVAVVAGIHAIALGHTSGVLWGVAGAICFIVGTLYYAKFCRSAELLTANFVQLGTAAVFCWLVVLFFEEIYVSVTPVLVWSFLYLTFGVSLGGMGLYLFMLRTGVAGKVAANFYITPGLTAILGWAVLGEVLPPNVVVGFVITIVGLWLVHHNGDRTTS